MKISISALSVAYGLTPEAIRFYEEKGLLMPERAGAGGFRRFSLNDVQRIGFIKSYQRQGFSLDEIKYILTECPQDALISMMDEKGVWHLMVYDTAKGMWHREDNTRAMMFTTCGITGCPISSFLKEIWPFILCLVIVLLLLTFCPILIDIVPNLIYGPVGAGGI